MQLYFIFETDNFVYSKDNGQYLQLELQILFIFY